MPVESCTAIVPAWDLGDVLSQALESLRRQKCIERVVVVDNASAEALETDDADVIQLPRRVSVGAARNVGLGAAQTPYICFMDGDDVLLPGALDRLVRLLTDRKDAVAAAGQIMIWRPVDDMRVRSFYPPPLAWRLQRYERAFALINSVINLFPPVGATVIRADTARAVGGFPDLDYLETWCFGLALTLMGPIILDPVPAKLYRVDPARTTLKSQGIGRFREEWLGRSQIRATLRQLKKNRVGLLLGASLVPIHGVQALLALRRRRPRQVALVAETASPHWRWP